jgi:1D-myo-inositol 3-kinase
VSILVVGHYCHDTLLRNESVHHALGGSAAYAAAVLDAVGEPCQVLAKVGADFRYAVAHAPTVVAGSTTAFVDDYRGPERRERVESVAPPIEPGELSGAWDVGLACGIVGEVPRRTLERLRQVSRIAIADAQSILRVVSPGGEILLRPPEPGVAGLLDVLKASRVEAAVLDVAALRRDLTLLITDGARGCTILRGDSSRHVPALAAEEVDPTGAGDCFLAGFAAAMARGFPVERAVRIGAWFGARAVEQVGIPNLSAEDATRALQLGAEP